MSKPYKLPPPENDPRPLIGPNVRSFSVGSWCPTQDGSGKPECVAISVEVDLAGKPVDLVIRIKSPMELDRIVQMLLRHKRDVWPDAQ